MGESIIIIIIIWILDKSWSVTARLKLEIKLVLGY